LSLSEPWRVYCGFVETESYLQGRTNAYKAFLSSNFFKKKIKVVIALLALPLGRPWLYMCVCVCVICLLKTINSYFLLLWSKQIWQGDRCNFSHDAIPLTKSMVLVFLKYYPLLFFSCLNMSMVPANICHLLV